MSQNKKGPRKAYRTQIEIANKATTSGVKQHMQSINIGDKRHRDSKVASMQ